MTNLQQTFEQSFRKAGGQIIGTWQDLPTWCAAQGVRKLAVDSVGVPESVATALQQAGVETLAPDACNRDALFNEVGAGLTHAAAGIAETGTFVQPHDNGDDRLLSLAPPMHVTVLSPTAVHADLSTVFAAGVLTPETLPAAMTLITGPSRTADIEQTLTIGIHGPLQAWLLWDAS